MDSAVAFDRATVVVKRTFWEFEVTTDEEALGIRRCRSYSDPLHGSLCSPLKYEDDDWESPVSTECHSNASELDSITSWAVCSEIDDDKASEASRVARGDDHRDSRSHEVAGEFACDVALESCLPAFCVTAFPCCPAVLGPMPPLVQRAMSAATDVPLQATRPAKRRSGRSANVGKAARTTLILKNLPTTCTRAKVEAFLNAAGFVGCYNFIYLPTNLRDLECCCYGFVNMETHAAAESLLDTLQGFDSARFLGRSDKPLEVCWSDNLQGIKACIERYRNSPVMHPAVPAEYRPSLFSCGVPVSFPLPTAEIKAPKLRRSKNQRPSTPIARHIDA